MSSKTTTDVDERDGDDDDDDGEEEEPKKCSALTMMSPIQLQDVARKQFEDRERRRAQQVRRRSVAKGIRPAVFFKSLFFFPSSKKGGLYWGSFLRIKILRPLF